MLARLRNKFFCVFERLYYRIRLLNLYREINNWHLNGTFYCRDYKIKALDIIHKIKPGFVIDIGCGLGDLTARIKLPSEKKCGFDIEKPLEKAINRLYPKRFYFFSNENRLEEYVKLFYKKEDQPLLIICLNYLHTISHQDFIASLSVYLKKYGSFLLLADSINFRNSEFPFMHKDCLENLSGLQRTYPNVDSIRSIYLISINKNNLSQD